MALRMNRLYAVGGRQRTRTINVEEWNRYNGGLILVLDPDRKEVLQQHDYLTPEQFRPSTPSPSILFKSATLQDDRIYVCTQTEVMVYRLPGFEVEHHVSLPCFNDVHHVVPTASGSLLIAVTGLDLVLEISVDGEVLREWSVTPDDTWDRFSREVDYRKRETTKPHQSHPNFVFQNADDVWVTRFEQKDAICLTAPGKRIDIGIERAHDGFVFGGKVYFLSLIHI